MGSIFAAARIAAMAAKPAGERTARQSARRRRKR
jgi:hypothetical protein